MIITVKKSKRKFGFPGESRIYQIQFFFLAEVLHIISTFSTCPAVLQISRTSECLMTQRYKKYKGTKKVEFLSFTCIKLCSTVSEKSDFFCKKFKFERLFNSPFNAIKAHLVAVFVVFCDGCFFY